MEGQIDLLLSPIILEAMEVYAEEVYQTYSFRRDN
jgi:hypothetical protein